MKNVKTLRSEYPEIFKCFEVDGEYQEYPTFYIKKMGGMKAFKKILSGETPEAEAKNKIIEALTPRSVAPKYTYNAEDIAHEPIGWTRTQVAHSQKFTAPDGETKTLTDSQVRRAGGSDEIRNKMAREYAKRQHRLAA